MRQKRVAVLCFEWAEMNGSAELKIVRDWRGRYKRISEILDDNPLVLDLADRDLKALSQGGKNGRRGVYTSENLLRALIVHFVEASSLRETIIRISESPFLQDFLRLGNRPVMDFTFLDRALKALGPETVERMNAVLARYGARNGLVDPTNIRTDTTVVETNIHYPTDGSLLWDSWRTLARLLRVGRSEAPELCVHRFHERKAKRPYLRIMRYGRSKSARRQRMVKRSWRELIERVHWIVRAAEAFCAGTQMGWNLGARAVAHEIEGFLPAIRKVASVAERVALNGETVPARERVFSIFEQHTELICRGKARKPVEFGHAIQLSQTKDKFISGYKVMEHRIPDSRLAPESVKGHKRVFGAPPKGITGDMGFNMTAQERAALEKEVETLAIPRRLSDWVRVIGSLWQRFRVGIEGTISVLKRAYRLLRCPYRGFRSFAVSTGMAIVCHNLVVLANNTA